MSAPTVAALNRITESAELGVAMRRIINALARRAVEDGDVEALATMKELAGHLDEQTTEAIRGLRHHEVYPSSWGEIAEALGVTRKAVRDRYGHVGGRRQPGGQPANLR